MIDFKKSDDWHDWVGYQPLSEDASKIFYLYVKPDVKDGNIEFTLLAEKITCDLSEEQMLEQVDALLSSFPKTPYPINKDKDSEQIQNILAARAANEIAKRTRRGMGNTKYKNSLYYRGNSFTDSPIIVAENNGLYGVFKHPDFEKYGFTL